MRGAKRAMFFAYNVIAFPAFVLCLCAATVSEWLADHIQSIGSWIEDWTDHPSRPRER